MTKEMCKRFYIDPKKSHKYEYTPLRKSTIDPNVYSQIEFVRYTLNNNEELFSDFSYQERNGFFGHYSAYVYIPYFWKFSVLSVPEMNQELGLEDITISIKRKFGPDGSDPGGCVCIGWTYKYHDKSTEIDSMTIGLDLIMVTKKIVEWEWKYESDMMLKISLKQLMHSLSQISFGNAILKREGITYDEEKIRHLIEEYDILPEFDHFKDEFYQ